MDVSVGAVLGSAVAGLARGSYDVSRQAVNDAYAGIKNLVRERVGANSGADDAIAQLEGKPASQARQAMVDEELADAGLADERELIDALNVLREAMGETVGQGDSVQIAHGQGIAQASGRATATVNWVGGADDE